MDPRSQIVVYVSQSRLMPFHLVERSEVITRAAVRNDVLLDSCVHMSCHHPAMLISSTLNPKPPNSLHVIIHSYSGEVITNQLIAGVTFSFIQLPEGSK